MKRGLYYGAVTLQVGNKQSNQFGYAVVDDDAELIAKLIRLARERDPDGAIVNAVAVRIEDDTIRAAAAELGEGR